MVVPRVEFRCVLVKPWFPTKVTKARWIHPWHLVKSNTCQRLIDRLQASVHSWALIAELSRFDVLPHVARHPYT